MRCPGQDTRFWKPDDIFDIPCQSCGRPVEFFKTDVFRRCPSCGKRIQNPKVSLGCARWCAYAKECLGFDPQELDLPDSAEVSLADRLIEAVKNAFGEHQQRITHSLLVLDRAQELLRREEGNPRVVLAAALLHDIGARDPGGGNGRAPGEGPSVCPGEVPQVDSPDHAISCSIGSTRMPLAPASSSFGRSSQRSSASTTECTATWPL